MDKTQNEYFGIGSISNLDKILSTTQPSNIFLVTGKASYESSGAKTALTLLFTPYKVTHFTDFTVNPRIDVFPMIFFIIL